MKIINFSSRWVYSGSLTTPPCTTGVYHHVVDRVLPIKKEHLDGYVAHQSTWLQTNQFDTAGTVIYTKSDTLDKYGNWRVAQKIDNQNVSYLVKNEDPTWWIALIAVGGFIIFALSHLLKQTKIGNRKVV